MNRRQKSAKTRSFGGHDKQITRKGNARRVNSGKALDLATACALVQALGVALLADGERGSDVAHDEWQVSSVVNIASKLPVCLVRRDERRQSDDPTVCKELRHFTHATNVLRAIWASEDHGDEAK